ncbi:hypothetical protein [Lacticaseibacillus porcinae]|uniref:hypothetical protein n=1 Tax=Lacticaseibacillus porcinae TaxID=1123687 RepID=UPI000F78D576|nr:hypothetical protein [Lacticaseibacillus porcinae]
MNWRLGVLLLSLLIGSGGCSNQSTATPVRRFAVVAQQSHQVGTLVQRPNHQWYLSWDDHNWYQVQAKVSCDGWHATAYDRFGTQITE